MSTSTTGQAISIGLRAIGARKGNRTIKDATVKRFYYETHDQLREHLANFVAAYNFAKRLKTLKGLTPYEYICKCWTKEPQRFTLTPHHQTPGPNSARALRRWPCCARPRKRVIFVVVAVSSMKTSRCVCARMRGWRCSRHRRRASQTSSRPHSDASSAFFISETRSEERP